MALVLRHFSARMSRIVPATNICCCAACGRGAREPPTCLFFGFPSGRLGPGEAGVTARIDRGKVGAYPSLRWRAVLCIS